MAVVAGFVTPDGVDALDLLKPSNAGKLSRFVIGAGTYRAFEAIDRLILAGVPPIGVRIHLGHSRLSGGKRNPFHRYHPMLHSKIYLFEMDDGTAAAFVGSHNVTGFALRGLNGEAGVLLEGLGSDPPLTEVRTHIDQAYLQAVAYDPSMKEAYAWWTREYFEGLRAEASDSPRDSEPRRTVVVVAAQPAGLVPRPDDVIYFEIAEELSESGPLTRTCTSISSAPCLARRRRPYPNFIWLSHPFRVGQKVWRWVGAAWNWMLTGASRIAKTPNSSRQSDLFGPQLLPVCNRLESASSET
jgi:hypothetical protein